ncbi:DNA phosphorothioation-associated putative methyltransferase [Phormidium sp. CCY1219]|uniref:DNA phosphorothioation-associated putative methyltransferase n=1 Tax=Phormidium sp. CCY1219 TaxID=2886104 RepID=UPI002D1EFB0F|nr:DNA phosphorothioation-associated putative methyltransferase [Phormidium sp. CCY1219]MEB3828001.1 DNA phosphorothioation-associated putative methyltransferase [Phormidium sp. CCY1219]
MTNIRLSPMQTPTDRHAPGHHHLPRPLRVAVEGGILTPETSFLDYGSDRDRTPCNLVYLPDELNALPSDSERQAVLREAWQLCDRALIVAAAVAIADRSREKIAYSKSGIIPQQSSHYYWQPAELKRYIEDALQVDAVAADVGVFFIFRDPNLSLAYRHSQVRSRIDLPELDTSLPEFAESEEILTPLIDFVAERGRLPVAGECATEAEIAAKFGSWDDAFECVLAASDRQGWEKLRENRREDLTIYCACEIETRGEAEFWHRVRNCPQLAADILAAFENWETARDRAAEAIAEVKQPDFIARAWETSAIGKKLPTALYVHRWAIASLHPSLRLYDAIARRYIGCIEGATLVKFNIDKPTISYLYYPHFDSDPHPALQASLHLHLRSGKLSYADYENSDNPPVLHRKEAFVTPDYPLYDLFATLTRQEAKLGLLKKSRPIGTRNGWLDRLAEEGVKIEGHTLIHNPQEKPQTAPSLPKIERHRAAIVRRELSRPMRLALEAGLFDRDTTFFDYGCGHGGDIQRIAERGHSSEGWDPYYRPDTPLAPADVVNLGYVINVIEDREERELALKEAWTLAHKALVVAALVLLDDRGSDRVAYGDGVITRRNTFQKYYEQEELKDYIESVLGVEAIPAALGIYFVFRDEATAEWVKASRFRSRTKVPKVIKKFDDYRELLTPLMEFVSDRGRLPVKGELPQAAEICSEFRTLRRAFNAIVEVSSPEEWEAIAQKRRQDLLTYIAVSNLIKRTPFSHFPKEIQTDIKAFFGSYKNICFLTQKLIYSLNDLHLIETCCKESKIGLHKPNSLTVHVSALESLDPLLRIYEGIISRIIGRMDEATLIKFYTKKRQISYLFCPDFDSDPHPALYTSMQINLETFRVFYRDYDIDDNPPLLHGKDACVTPDYPDYEKFAKLTRQEEDWGLFEDYRAIKRRKGWLNCLVEHCAELRGYKLYWRKDADPYRVKVLKAAVRTRQQNRKAVKT